MKSPALTDFWRQYQTNTRKIPYGDLEVMSSADLAAIARDERAALAFCERITKGVCVLVKGVFTGPALEAMQKFSRRFRHETEESFHKMLDGVVDFHRIINRERAKLYSLYAIKHSHYMFRWNATTPEMKKIWSEIDSYWRIMKYLGGYAANEYEANIPSAGPTDRVQFVHYPAKGGVLRDHVDPDHNQKFVIGINMSTRGVEYQQGGFYVLDAAGQRIDLEQHISVGDALVCDARIVHGVSEVDPAANQDEPEWNRETGRWYLGLYSNDSDHGKRVTATNLQK
jgi:hypothetical protein